MNPKPILACLLGAALGGTPAAQAALGVTNGNFETGGGSNIDNVTEWFDRNTGNFWEAAWQTNAAWITPNGTNVVLFSNSGATSDPLIGSYLYQAIGTADGASSVTIGFDFGAPNDAGAGLSEGMTVAIYAFDGIGTFVPGDNVDLYAASQTAGSGVTLLSSDSSAQIVTTGVDGQISSYQVTLDLSGAGTQQLFLSFNNYKPSTTECWPILDNVTAVAVGLAPTFTDQPDPSTGNVGGNITLTATAVSDPAPTYQWQYSPDGVSSFTDLVDGGGISGATTNTLTIDPAEYYAHQGFYQVVANNGIAMTISDAAEVTLSYPAPAVTAQPQGGAVQAGSDASLTVAATGLGTLSYQWYKDNAPLTDGGAIFGSSTATLGFVFLQAGEAGTYHCVVTDHAATEQGSGETDATVQTSNAVLEVFDAPASTLLSFEPFSAYPEGVILTDQNPAIDGYSGAWLDEAYGDVPPKTSAGSLAYGGAGYVAGVGGKVGTVVDTAAIGTGNSGRAARVLAANLKGSALSSQTRYLSWLFKTGNEGTAPSDANNYQVLALWNGASGTDSLRVFEAGIALNDIGTANYGFRINNNNTLRQDLGVAADTGVHLFVAKFELNPADNSDSVTVWIDPALGAGEPAGGVSVTGVNLMWDRLTLSDYAGDSSNWDEIRWGTTFDSVTTEAPLVPVIPEITLQPTNENEFVGGAVSLEVVADGDPAPTYQWEVSPNGTDSWVPVSGGDSATLVFDPAAYSDNGFYRAVATNINGSVTSDTAQVTISYPNPEVTQQPVSSGGLAGSDIQLSVIATGIGNLSYQWYKVDAGGDIELTGETNATLQLTDLAAGDAGSYYVIVSDDAAVVDGLPATTTQSVNANVVVYDLLITASATAPTIDSADQYYLPEVAADADNVDGGVDTATYIAFDRSSKGMSFTTGSDPAGYSLSSVTIQLSAYSHWHNVQNGDMFELSFGTLSGTTKNVIYQSSNAGYSGTPHEGSPDVGGDFLTFDLSDLGLGVLLPETTYYFEITTEAGDPFFEWNGTSLDGYAGGSAFRGDTVATIDGTYTELAGDRAFHVDLTGLSGPADDFSAWIANYPGVGAMTGFTDDADGDGIKNALENYFGTDPSSSNQGIVQVAKSGSTVTFQHPNANPASDVSGAYVWSTNLSSYHDDGASDGATTVTFSASPDTPTAGTTTVTATITGTVPAKLFVAVKAMLATP